MSPQRVLITGGATGIGKAVATAFTAAGAQVHIGDVDRQGLDEFGSVTANLGTSVANVADPDQVAGMFAAVRSELGGLDVLVNNAGIAGPAAHVESVRVEDWAETIAVNLSGQFHCIREAVPLLREAHGGSIVNIASSAGLMGYPMRAPYAASKWGVIGLTKTLAMELGESGIRVNAVCPGPVEGDRMKRVIAAEAAATSRPIAEVRAGYVAQTSLGRFIAPAEIATAVIFLSSPEACNITGQVLSVDGNTETLRTQ